MVMQRLLTALVVFGLLALAAGMSPAQGRYTQPPDIPIGTWGGFSGSAVPYGYGDWVYGTPYGYAPYGSTGPYGYGYRALPEAVEPWAPDMIYDRQTGYWYPPDGGAPRRYDRSVVRVFDPRFGGTVYMPRNVYEQGVWEEAPRFRFERSQP
jgi:hypothetical protein